MFLIRDVMLLLQMMFHTDSKIFTQEMLLRNANCTLHFQVLGTSLGIFHCKEYNSSIQ